MKKQFVMLLVLAGFLISGCSIKMTSYAPAILMEGSGKVKVGEFVYLASDNNTKIKSYTVSSNQIDTGMGLNPIYTDNDLKDYVADALAKELKYIGYKLSSDSDIVISGNIHEWSCDYVGVTTVDVLTKIEFIVTAGIGDDKKEIYRKIHDGEFSANKFMTMELTAAVNEGLRNCIKSFMADVQKIKVL